MEKNKSPVDLLTGDSATSVKDNYMYLNFQVTHRAAVLLHM